MHPQTFLTSFTILLISAQALAAPAEQKQAAAAVPAPVMQTVVDLDRPIVTGTKATVTTGDFKSDLLRLPEEMRGSFAIDGRRVAASLNSLLTSKSLAAEARELGLDKDPLNARAVQVTVDRVLAQLRMDALDKQAGREFDQAIEANTKKAKEIYTVNPERYRQPEQVRAAHILIQAGKRSDAEAKEQAEKIRAEALAGKPFKDLAERYSGDTGSRAKGGDVGYFDQQTMVKPFADAAFAMNKEGEISPVVKSQFGYHIIQFLGRKPPTQLQFEEVKARILAEMRTRFQQDTRGAHVAKYHADGVAKVDYEAVESLKVKLDPETYRKATEEMLHGGGKPKR
ncbi:MAG: peptidyl-prolyl cis-trans isomerase [Betaproteobacteria bacterium]|nr:peptidyl-prolyl cis-trans isomerase [Betaproteobacteria bacterium]